MKKQRKLNSGILGELMTLLEEMQEERYGDGEPRVNGCT